jgi:hypothetical protein
MSMMKIPSESEIKSAGEFFGICGTVFTTLKAVAGYWTDRSLERKKEKTLDEIEICTGRIHKLDETKELAQEPGMQEYRNYLTEDLRKKLQTLNVVIEKSRERDAKRDDDPKGVRGWLLLYRPEGFDGWIVHSMFYFSVLICAMFILVIPLILWEQSGQDRWISLLLFLDFGLFAAFALYLRGISRRLRTVARDARKNGGKDANADLNWWRKAVLSFKTSGRAKIVKGFYYFALFECLSLTFVLVTDVRIMKNVQMRADSKFSGIAFSLLMIGVVLMITEVLRADVLARRALSKSRNA